MTAKIMVSLALIAIAFSAGAAFTRWHFEHEQRARADFSTIKIEAGKQAVCVVAPDGESAAILMYEAMRPARRRNGEIAQ